MLNIIIILVLRCYDLTKPNINILRTKPFPKLFAFLKHFLSKLKIMRTRWKHNLRNK